MKHLIILLVLTTSCNATKKYDRKCRKQAQKVEDAARICPSLIKQDTVYLEVPVLTHDTILDIWFMNDCDSCEFKATSEGGGIESTVTLSKGKLTKKTTAVIAPIKIPCPPSIVSANIDLSAALAKCQSDKNKEAIAVGMASERLKKARWLSAAGWLLALILGAFHLFRSWNRIKKILPFCLLLIAASSCNPCGTVKELEQKSYGEDSVIMINRYWIDCQLKKVHRDTILLTDVDRYLF